MKVIAIIVAAGEGKRIKQKEPKQFLLVNNKFILAYSLEVFEGSTLIDRIILVVPKNIFLAKGKICKKYNFIKNFLKIEKIIFGGKERQHSVYNALKYLENNNDDIVLIHDGVRPLVKKTLISKVVNATKKFGAVIPGIPVKETIKQVDKNQFVSSTLRRNILWSIQTPQGFKLNLIKEAYEKAIQDRVIATDDASLVERLGYRVKIVKGEEENIKITTPMDLEFITKKLR